MQGKIRVGTSSWSDPGFIADWYPKTITAADRLRWYSQFFDLVELNSSFYGIPDQKNVAKWCEQTPRNFVFDVKLHKYLSRHSTKPEMLPPDIRKRAQIQKGVVLHSPEIEKAVAQRFLEQLEPFRESKKLGALLLQLSPGFSPRSHKLTELEQLVDLFKAYDLAVELRNRNWVEGEQLESTRGFYQKHGIIFVMVDAPEDQHFTIMPAVDVITSPKMGYLRAHGRNVKGYITGRTVAERFNHQYSESELQQIATRTKKMAEEVKEFHVLYNNNASDYAPRAAKTFKEMIK